MTFNRRHIIAGLGSAALIGCQSKNAKSAHQNDADVLILGAGLAGLRAAQILSEAGKNVLVLEANDRVGGRVHTLHHSEGHTEAGGARVRTNDQRLRSLASDLGLTFTADTARFEDYAYWIDGTRTNYSTWAKNHSSTYESPFVPAVSDSLIKGGAQRLPETMADQLLRPPVLKTYIKALSVTEDGVTATDHTGRVWRAPKMVCALPYSALNHLRIESDLQDEKKLEILSLPYVQNLQVHFRAKTRFWENDGLPVDMWTDGPIGRIIASRDASGQPTGLFRSTLYGNQIHALYQGGAKGLHQRFRAEIMRLRPSTYAAIEILEIANWTKDNQAAGGAYLVFLAGQNSSWVNTLGQNKGPLHFAGSHLSATNIGMEGALESAERAAAAVLA